jgi:hypothetical protein
MANGQLASVSNHYSNFTYCPIIRDESTGWDIRAVNGSWSSLWENGRNHRKSHAYVSRNIRPNVDRERTAQ